MATPYSPYDPAAAAAAQRMALMGKLAGEAPEAVPGAGGVDPSYGPSFRTAPPFTPGGVPASGDTGIAGPIQLYQPPGLQAPTTYGNDNIMTAMPEPPMPKPPPGGLTATPLPAAPAPPANPLARVARPNDVTPQPGPDLTNPKYWDAQKGWIGPPLTPKDLPQTTPVIPPENLQAATLPIFSEPPPPGATDTPGGPIDAPTGGVIGPGAGVIPPDAGAFAPPKPGGPVKLGPFANKLGAVNSQKLNDPNHQSPKYQILRTLTNFDPANGVPIEALNALGIGTFTADGKDKIHVSNADPRFEGVTSFDLIVDSDNAAGKRHWAFQPTGGGGGDVGGKDAGGGGVLGGLGSPLLGTDALGNVNANIDQFMQGLGANERTELMKLLGQAGMQVGAQLKQPQPTPAPKG